MCNAASDGDRYSGRKEPAEVRGGHGDGVETAPHFCVCLLWDVTTKQKPEYFPSTANTPQAHDIGHNYAVNGPIYTIRGYEWIAKKV